MTRGGLPLLPETLGWFLQVSTDASPYFVRQLASQVTRSAQEMLNSKSRAEHEAVRLLVPVLIELASLGEFYMLPGSYNVVLDHVKEER